MSIIKPSVSHSPAKVGRVVWFTGLPCAGKTSVAAACVEQRRSEGRLVEHLDGDSVRAAIDFTLFSQEARELHLRYIAFMASRLAANGVEVFCSFVSPLQAHRDFARSLCSDFIEVYVATTAQLCEQRDVKGHYARARKGEISNFTGVDGVYEPPNSPEITIETEDKSVSECVDLVLTSSYFREVGGE